MSDDRMPQPFTDAILSIVAERPPSRRASWVSNQFALFYHPRDESDGSDRGQWVAMIGGSSMVMLGEAEPEFEGTGNTAEEALADLSAKMAAAHDVVV